MSGAPEQPGMLYPTTPFVGAEGQLTPLAFRFLFELWRKEGNLATALQDVASAAAVQSEMTETARQLLNLEQRVAALEATTAGRHP